MSEKTDRYAPSKIDLQKIREGLSRSQMNKIMYECDLLRLDAQKLLYIAPHLFNDGVTASNTNIVEPEPTKDTAVKETEVEESYPTYYNYGDDYNTGYYPA